MSSSSLCKQTPWGGRRLKGGWARKAYGLWMWAQLLFPFSSSGIFEESGQLVQFQCLFYEIQFLLLIFVFSFLLLPGFDFVVSM
jgi:hypothetical protein